jgi:hypothetical protein
MSLGAGRIIECESATYVNFQMVAMNGQYNVVWLYIPLVTEVFLTSLVFEELRGSGPFRIEGHKGRIIPQDVPSTPDVVTLDLFTFGPVGEWSVAAGWSMGGIKTDGDAFSDEEGEDDWLYYTLVIYPLSKRTAGAGLRVRVEGSSG